MPPETCYKLQGVNKRKLNRVGCGGQFPIGTIPRDMGQVISQPVLIAEAHLTRCTPDAIGEAGAEPQLKVVDGDVVEHAVRPRQVDVLENARAHLRPEVTRLVGYKHWHGQTRTLNKARRSIRVGLPNAN